MADRPINLRAHEVRSIIAGRQTQVRRIIEPQPHGRYAPLVSFNHGRMEIAFGPDMRAKGGGPKWWRPMAQTGDFMWCRETLKRAPHLWTYAADGAEVGWPARGEIAGRYRDTVASNHMPRIASRITLYVTEVRVQRLQDISEDDARAEGAYVGGRSGRVADSYFAMAVEGRWFANARRWYADLWDRINGTGAWDANPWVATYTFKPVLSNIDSLPTRRDAA